MTDYPTFAQDIAGDICMTASEVQQKAHHWRQAAHKGYLFDPQHVVIQARETARRLYELANEIERRGQDEHGASVQAPTPRAVA